MDKHGKTITIKINGKDRPVNEQKTIQDADSGKEQDSYREDTVFSYKNEERSRVYPLVEDPALHETAAAQEQAEESFDWILPEPDQVKEESLKEYKIAPMQTKKPKKKSIGISLWNNKTKRNNRLYTTIFVTVFFAVLLGSAFGVTILKFVTADSGTVTTVSTPAKTPPAAEQPASGKESLEMKAIPAFIVQNGVFTTEEGAKERVNLLSGQGVAAEIFPVNGQFAVYLGTGGSIEAAKQQAEALKAKGVEVFAKPFEIAGGSAAGLTGEEAKFLQQAPDIYSILISGAGASPEAVKKVEDYQVLLGKISDKNVKDKNILKAKSSIEKASASFLSYQKSKDANQLAEVEKGLLAFLAAYQSIGK